MRRLLILSYYFPPRQGIGAQRPYRLAKYLPRFGWEPVVVTAKLPGNPPAGMKVIETGYADFLAMGKSLFGFKPDAGLHEQLKISVSNPARLPVKSRAIRLAKEIIAFPDEQKGWLEFAIDSASKVLSNGKVDAILSTSSPVTAHLAARELKKKYGLPWVADLRDLWTQNHFYDKHKLIKLFERGLERRVLSSADALVTVTREFESELGRLHRGRKVYCITNGFDPDDYPTDARKKEKTPKFTMTHTGSLYGGRRDPAMLFAALGDLIKKKMMDRELIEVEFYGHVEPRVEELIKNYSLQDVVFSKGHISRKDALERQRQSHVLVLLLDKDNREQGVYPAKLFEYFGAARPIIAFGGRRAIVDELLKETNAGVFFAADNMDKLKDAVMGYYMEFVKTGDVESRINARAENYTYEAIARSYSGLLNTVAAANDRF